LILLFNYNYNYRFLIFFLIHIFQVIKTGWNNFQAMISGLEVIKPEKQIAVNEIPATDQ